jgi:hypothetical protein
MSQKVNGNGKILNTRPHYGIELNKVGDGHVHTVVRKGLNNCRERQAISEYGEKKKKKSM